jgi:hypothetical protein
MWVDEYAAGAVIVTSCLFNGVKGESLDKKSRLDVIRRIRLCHSQRCEC